MKNEKVPFIAYIARGEDDGKVVPLSWRKRVQIWIDNLFDKILIAVGRGDEVQPTNPEAKAPAQVVFLVVRKTPDGVIIESVWTRPMAAIHEANTLHELFPDREYTTLPFKMDCGIVEH